MVKVSVKQGGIDELNNLSYFFLVSCLVEKFHDFFGQLVVGSGPNASSFVALDHDRVLYVSKFLKIN